MTWTGHKDCDQLRGFVGFEGIYVSHSCHANQHKELAKVISMTAGICGKELGDQDW